MLKQVILKNFKSNIRNYLLFFMSNTVAISLLLVFWGLKYNLAKSIKDEASSAIMNMDFMIATIMLSLTAIFLTVYAVQNYVRLRIRDYSMLTVFGIRKKVFQKIIFAEYGLGWLLSLAAGLAFGNIIYYLFQRVLIYIAPDIMAKSNIGLKAYLYSVIISLSIIIVVVLATLTLMEGKNLDTYAGGKEVREKKAKNWKWFLVVLLGVALWIVGNVRFPIGDGGPVYAQVLWIIAAFLVMYFGGSILLEGAKKRQKFYYKNLLRLNQLYHHFTSNYMIIFMLFILHFFALGYVTSGIAECFPLRIDRNLYPYDFVCSVQEKDTAFMETVADKYHGTIEEVPIIKVAAFNGLDNYGISETLYEKMEGEECNLDSDEIILIMESPEEKNEISDRIIERTFELIHLGKFRGENVIYDSYKTQGYQKIRFNKILTGNIFGQMVDKYRDACIVLPDAVFEKAREKILNDPEEPSVAVALQIPEEYREQAGAEIEKYMNKYGIKAFGHLQSNYYNTDEVIRGKESRNIFKFSNKFFIVLALLFSSIFILKMKSMSDEDMTLRRYSFLNCMGMQKKKRVRNLRSEIRCIALIPLFCGLFLGINYVLDNWDAYRRIGEELSIEFWRIWGIVILIYLAIQIVCMEWVARTASHNTEKKM